MNVFVKEKVAVLRCPQTLGQQRWDVRKNWDRSQISERTKHGRQGTTIRSFLRESESHIDVQPTND